MSVWVLVCLIMIGGQPSKAMFPTDTKESCEASKAELTKELIAKYGDFEGGLVCVEVPIAEKHT